MSGLHDCGGVPVPESGPVVVAGAAAAGPTGRSLWRRCTHFMGMLVGVPDYDAYLAHMRERHPEHMAMTREQFVRSRMEARLGARGVGKCPC